MQTIVTSAILSLLFTLAAVAGNGTISNPDLADNASVALSKLELIQNGSLVGNASGGVTNPQQLNSAQATSLLNAFVGDSGSGGQKGVVPAPASGDAAANKFLKANGNWSAVAVNSMTVSAKTANYTVLNTDQIISASVVSAVSFSLTLPTAVGNAGLTQYFHRIDDAPASAIYLIPQSGQTINEGASVVFIGKDESATLYSDGANWKIINRRATTQWRPYAVTITGSSSNPTKGTTATDQGYWRREGDSIKIRYEYRQTAAGSGAAGSGVYLFSLPAGIVIDTTKITAASTSAGAQSLGTGLCSDGSTTSVGAVYARSTTGLSIVTENASNTQVGSTLCPLNGSTANIGFEAAIPISGWGN